MRPASFTFKETRRCAWSAIAYPKTSTPCLGGLATLVALAGRSGSRHSIPYPEQGEWSLLTRYPKDLDHRWSCSATSGHPPNAKCKKTHCSVIDEARLFMRMDVPRTSFQLIDSGRAQSPFVEGYALRAYSLVGISFSIKPVVLPGTEPVWSSVFL